LTQRRTRAKDRFLPAGQEIDVSEWLDALGLGAYAEAFRANHVGADTLPSLTTDDLKELGVVSVGHRRRMLDAIATLHRRTAEPGPARDPPRRDPHPEGERRQVTVLFADIAGYTALSSELDAEQVHALLSAFFERVDGVITGLDGRIDKHIGDCAMAVFGVPVAHGDDVRRAVAAALAIHAGMAAVSAAVGRKIAAHVGIASGEVVASRTGSVHYEEFTVTGETVNLASRLTGLASDGETVVSHDIVEALGDTVVADSGGSVLVKGLAAPVDIWRVRELRDAGPPPRPVIGRHAEMAQCEAALATAQGGETGAILYVRGEPGIGKSSVAAETLRRAERLGFAHARAAVFDFGTALDRDPLRALSLALLGPGDVSPEAVAGFAAAHELATADVAALKDLTGIGLSLDERRLLDATSPENRLASRGVALATLAIAAARHAPLLVVVEDVHWADPVVLQGLAAMARLACGRSRAVFLMTARLESDPLPVLRSLLGNSPLTVIELGRLADRDARSLARSLLDEGDPLLDECLARAGGNPLFLGQLIRHASTSGARTTIPGSIRSVVTAQIDRLADTDRIALRAAAVLGQQFSVDALRHVLGHEAWAPGSLIANRLLLPGEDTLQFAHGLIREAVHASILKGERRRLHLAAADWFLGRDTALRAEHLAHAQSPQAVSTYLAAVDELVARYRVDEALGLLSRADAVAEDPADRFAVHLRQGEILTDAGRSTDATRAYERAFAAAPDDEARARVKLGNAGALRLLDRQAEALALLDEAALVFSAAGRVAELARLEYLRGNLLFPLGRTEACEAAHRRAFDHARRCGSVELEAWALGGLADAAGATGRYVTANRKAAECIDLAREHGFGRIEMAYGPSISVFSGDTAGARATIERTIAMAADAGEPRAELTGRLVAMSLNIWSGRPDGVERHYGRAESLVNQLGAHRYRGMNLAMMGEAVRQAGDAKRALALNDEALALARDGGMIAFGPIVLGFRAVAAGRDAGFRRESIREGELALSRGGIALNASFFYPFAIESCLLAEEWPEARRLAAGFAARFAAERVPEIEFQIERARLLAELGERGATPSLLEALARCREAGRVLDYGLDLGLLDHALQGSEDR
jgi:class 3 adenylate cyclase/tetratricopeptide (TPR) repeat protein